MISIVYQRDKDKISLSIEGHALLAEKGKDVLCAAVSGMAQMMEIGLLTLGLKKK